MPPLVVEAADVTAPVVDVLLVVVDALVVDALVVEPLVTPVVLPEVTVAFVVVPSAPPAPPVPSVFCSAQARNRTKQVEARRVRRDDIGSSTRRLLAPEPREQTGSYTSVSPGERVNVGCVAGLARAKRQVKYFALRVIDTMTRRSQSHERAAP
jgi:hypothetical protein